MNLKKITLLISLMSFFGYLQADFKKIGYDCLALKAPRYRMMPQNGDAPQFQVMADENPTRVVQGVEQSFTSADIKRDVEIFYEGYSRTSTGCGLLVGSCCGPSIRGVLPQDGVGALIATGLLYGGISELRALHSRLATKGLEYNEAYSGAKRNYDKSHRHIDYCCNMLKIAGPACLAFNAPMPLVITTQTAAIMGDDAHIRNGMLHSISSCKQVCCPNIWNRR